MLRNLLPARSSAMRWMDLAMVIFAIPICLVLLFLMYLDLRRPPRLTFTRATTMPCLAL